MRVTLAAIDHNYHLSRKPAQRKDGGERGHRKYSKRSQKYHAEVVREEKSYNYFPFLISKMLQRRSQIGELLASLQTEMSLTLSRLHQH